MYGEGVLGPPKSYFLHFSWFGGPQNPLPIHFFKILRILLYCQLLSSFFFSFLLGSPAPLPSCFSFLFLLLVSFSCSPMARPPNIVPCQSLLTLVCLGMLEGALGQAWYIGWDHGVIIACILSLSTTCLLWTPAAAPIAVITAANVHSIALGGDQSGVAQRRAL